VKADGSGGEVRNLQMTGYQVSATQIVLSIYNPNPFTAYLCTPSNVGYPTAQVGRPALQVNGYQVVGGSATIADVQWPPADEGGAAKSRYGEINLAVTANPWMQDNGEGTALAVDLLADLYKAKPLLEQVDVVPDPSLQLVDRITLDDSDGSRVMDDCMITGITLSGGKASWGMQLNLTAVAPPRAWVMGVAGKSEMGTATYV
jgi:hypothetical protein